MKVTCTGCHNPIDYISKVPVKDRDEFICAECFLEWLFTKHQQTLALLTHLFLEEQKKVG